MAVLHCRRTQQKGLWGRDNPTLKAGSSSRGSKLPALPAETQEAPPDGREGCLYEAAETTAPQEMWLHSKSWEHTSPLNISPPCRRAFLHPQCPSSHLALGSTASPQAANVYSCSTAQALANLLCLLTWARRAGCPATRHSISDVCPTDTLSERKARWDEGKTSSINEEVYPP